MLGLAAGTLALQASAFYENIGPSGLGPYIAGVYTPIAGSKFYESYVEGWNLTHLFSFSPITSKGRMGWYTKVFTQINSVTGLCQIQGTAIVDVTPISGSQEFVDFMQLRNNPLLSGRANVHFGLAQSDRVTARVFDVSGRLVRTLADRTYNAGEYDLLWDGTDDGGRQMDRGVYFTQVKYARNHFSEAKKLTVLK